MKTTPVCLISMLALAPAPLSGVDPSPFINIQGVLLDSSGASIPEGDYSMELHLFDDELPAPPENEILVNMFTLGKGAHVRVANGSFSVELGGGGGAVLDGPGAGTYTDPGQVFRDFDDVWLEVRIDIAPGTPGPLETFSPRIRIAPSARALNAGSLQRKGLRDVVSASSMTGPSAALLETAPSRATAGGLPLGEAVVLRLDELDLEIHRQKRLDPETGAISIENVLMRPDGTMEPISNDQVRVLVDQDIQALRGRIGAIQPGFRDEVMGLLATDPATPIPVAITAPADRSTFPTLPPFDVLEQMTEEESEELTHQVSAELALTLGEQLQDVVAAVTGLGGDNVRASTFAPMVFAEMTPAEILELVGRTDLLWLVLDGRGEAVDLLNVSTCATGAQAVQAGVNPSGLEVAIIEATGEVDTCLPLADNFGGGFPITQHATQVAGVVGSTVSGFQGVAPGVRFLTAGDDSKSTAGELADRLWWALVVTSDGAEAYNMSQGFNVNSANGQWTSFDIVVDAFARELRRFISVSAGNMGGQAPCNGGFVTSPAIALNVLAVGNYNDQNLCLLGSGLLAPCCPPNSGTILPVMNSSCFVDPSSFNGDREEPDVAAPGTSIQTTNIGCSISAVSGTSFAAPHAAGAAALLIARNIGVEEWPELTRAILMASAVDNIEGAAALSEVDGAGGINIDEADTILANGQWNPRDLTSSDFSGSNVLTIASFTVPIDTDLLKVAIAWSGVTAINGIGLQTDFDLVLKQSGMVVAASASYDNSYEVVEVAKPSGTYTIEVHAFGPIASGGSEVERLGTAWEFLNPCRFAGLDTDDDGVCGDQDNCDKVANANQADFDNDGLGDVCDNCPKDFNPGQEDIDFDGVGDVCDPDKDNDGCLNSGMGFTGDQHPCSPVARSGIVVYTPACPDDADTNAYDSEAAPKDTDHDGFYNCLDRDDDNDGLCDDAETLSTGPGVPQGGCVGPDPCPLHLDNSGLFCTEFVDCPEPPWWLFCQDTACLEFLVKVIDPASPEPFVRFDEMVIVNQSLFLFPPGEKSLEEAGHCLLGGGGGSATEQEGGPRSLEAPLRLELWRKADPAAGAPEQFVALIAQYLPSDVALGDLSRGALLAVDLSDPTHPSETSLEVNATWVPGLLPGEEPLDGDGDTWPDSFDNCREHANASQTDTNGDRIGNRCDPDYDDDGIVGRSDLKILRKQVRLRCGDANFDPAVDADDDCAIGAFELRLLRSYFGDPPGPSGLVCTNDCE